MADEPDITDPELTPVRRAPDVTEPTLPPVAETVTQLDPVAPSNTLELEPVVPNTLDLEPDEAPKKKPVVLDVAPKDTRKAPPKVAKRGDGFDGVSMPSVTPVSKPIDQRRQTAHAYQFGAWILLALISSAVLTIIALLLHLFL